MESKMNKERSNNFSREELEKLKELLEKHSIIMNKKTDHASSKQKDEAWSRLTEEFNMDNPVYRTKKQLMYKFNNIKKNARKELSQEKKERRYTGGGPPPPKPSKDSEWICGIMSESIVGLPSTHDSDSYQANAGDGDAKVTTQQILLTDTDEITIHNSDIVNSNYNIPEDMDSIDIPFLDDQENHQNLKFDSSTPYAMLQKPVAKLLEPGRKRKLSFTPQETRKRIVTYTNEKETCLKKKNVREEKLLEYAEEEHRQNMRHKEELHEQLLKKARLEVQIQEEKLKRILCENKNLLNNFSDYSIVSLSNLPKY